MNENGYQTLIIWIYIRICKSLAHVRFHRVFSHTINPFQLCHIDNFYVMLKYSSLNKSVYWNWKYPFNYITSNFIRLSLQLTSNYIIWAIWKKRRNSCRFDAHSSKNTHPWPERPKVPFRNRISRNKNTFSVYTFLRYPWCHVTYVLNLNDLYQAIQCSRIVVNCTENVRAQILRSIILLLCNFTKHLNIQT